MCNGCFVLSRRGALCYPSGARVFVASYWVAEKRERCTESGILMEEFEESEDDEDPNKPGPVEAYAFRACGKACGTCE